MFKVGKSLRKCAECLWGGGFNEASELNVNTQMLPLLHIRPHRNAQQRQFNHHSSGGRYIFHTFGTVVKLWVACVVNDVLTLHLNYAQIFVSHLNFLLMLLSCFACLRL